MARFVLIKGELTDLSRPLACLVASSLRLVCSRLVPRCLFDFVTLYYVSCNSVFVVPK